MMGCKCHLILDLCLTVAVLSLKLPSSVAQPPSIHPLLDLDLAYASYLTQHNLNSEISFSPLGKHQRNRTMPA
jgi:hypothetical protein